MTAATVLAGRVIAGDKLGRKLGFPTANIDRRGYARRTLKLRLGVYAGTACIADIPREHPAAIVVGPLNAKGLPKIEAHLLHFSGNLYGKRLTLTLVRFLRPFFVYKNECELILQIRKDITNARRVLLNKRGIRAF